MQTWTWMEMILWSTAEHSILSATLSFTVYLSLWRSEKTLAIQTLESVMLRAILKVGFNLQEKIFTWRKCDQVCFTIFLQIRLHLD